MVALKDRADIERLYRRVVGPTLANLAPDEAPQPGEISDFNTFLDASRIMALVG